MYFIKLHCPVTSSLVRRWKVHQLPCVPRLFVPAASSCSPRVAQLSNQRPAAGPDWRKEKGPLKAAWDRALTWAWCAGFGSATDPFLTPECTWLLCFKIYSSCKIVTVLCPLLSCNLQIGKILQNNYRKSVTEEVNTKFHALRWGIPFWDPEETGARKRDLRLQRKLEDMLNCFPLF